MKKLSRTILILFFTSALSSNAFANTCSDLLESHSKSQPNLESFFDVDEDALGDFALYGDFTVLQLSSGEKVQAANLKDFSAQIKKVQKEFSADEEDYENIDVSVEAIAVVNQNVIVAYALGLTGVDQNDSNYSKSIVVDSDLKIRYETDWEYDD